MTGNQQPVHLPKRSVGRQPATSNQQPATSSYSAILFDMDGTLVDSERLKAEAHVETCAHYGGSAVAQEYQKVIGESWEIVIEHFCKVCGIQPAMDDYTNVFQKIYTRLLDTDLHPSPGIRDYLAKLQKNGVRLGVVSSSFAWMVDQILKNMDMEHYFKIKVAKENVLKHKPHPEAYLYALKNLGLTADQVLVYEDTRAGVKAAYDAGCDVCALRHDFNENHDFSLAKYVISEFI